MRLLHSCVMLHCSGIVKYFGTEKKGSSWCADTGDIAREALTAVVCNATLTLPSSVSARERLLYPDRASEKEKRWQPSTMPHPKARRI